MTATTATCEQEVIPHPSFLSEVFHNLSQPLTALHCSLELALDRDTTMEDLRATVQTALENAERLRERLLLLRALAAAADPGDLSQPTDLTGLFKDLRDAMLPLFETAGVNFDLQIDARPMQVRGNKFRLQQGTFCFLEYLLRFTRQEGTIAVRICERELEAEIVICADCALPMCALSDFDRTPYSCEIEMARRTFRAAGGDFHLVSSDSNSSVWRATLNLI